MNAEAETDIRPLLRGGLKAAATLCARAMRDNPVHIHCFGADPVRRERRLRRFFFSMLHYGRRRGLLLGAFVDRELVGIAGALAPGACRPAFLDILRLTPGMLVGNSPLSLWRTAHWLRAWLRADPDEPHWHMGPLAVASAWQGRGVALKLGRVLCNQINEHSALPLYLETDKWRNVRLYQAFGFKITGTRWVGSTPSWLMLRRNRMRLKSMQSSNE